MVGYVVTAKVGDMEDKTSYGRIRRMSKEVAECDKVMVGKKKY